MKLTPPGHQHILTHAHAGRMPLHSHMRTLLMKPPHAHPLPSRSPPHLSSSVQSCLITERHPPGKGEAPSSTQHTASPTCFQHRTQPRPPYVPLPIKRASGQDCALPPSSVQQTSFLHCQASSFTHEAARSTLPGHWPFAHTLNEDPAYPHRGSLLRTPPQSMPRQVSTSPVFPCAKRWLRLLRGFLDSKAYTVARLPPRLRRDATILTHSLHWMLPHPRQPPLCTPQSTGCHCPEYS
jgi:hypothetical protein